MFYEYYIFYRENKNVFKLIEIQGTAHIFETFLEIDRTIVKFIRFRC